MWPDRAAFESQLFDNLHNGSPIQAIDASPSGMLPPGDRDPCLEESEFDCYRRFRYFADFINNIYMQPTDPIRIQALASTEMSLKSAQEQPGYGRRYSIHYNDMKMGLLEIYADTVEYEDGFSIHCDIRLDEFSPRYLPFDEVYGFLAIIAGLLTSRVKLYLNRTEYDIAIDAIRLSMLEMVWAIPTFEYENAINSTFSVSFQGRPDRYNRLVKNRQKAQSTDQK